MLAERQADLVDKLGLAIGLDVYRAYREVMASERFLRLENAGARYHLYFLLVSMQI